MDDIPPQLNEVRLVNLGIGRQEDYLVTRYRKIVVHQQLAVVTIKSRERRINYNRQWSARGLCKGQ